MHSEGQESLAAWGRGVACGVDAGEVSDHVVAMWHGIGVVLCPIIGRDGLSALYRRSVDLTRVDHPCLPSAGELALSPAAFAIVHAALSHSSDTEAAKAADALLNAFGNLLGEFVGDALSERLLRSVRLEPPRDMAPLGTVS